MKVVAQGSGAGRDRSSEIGPGSVCNIECHGSAEVDDDGGRAILRDSSGCIRKTVGSNLLGLGIVDFDRQD